MSRTTAALCLLLLLLPSSHADDQVMEIIPLKASLLSDVLPTLQELVAPGGTVTGMNDQLIIRTTPANLADLKRVLETLDRPLRQLRITVRQDIEADTRIRSDELSGRFTAGDVSGGVAGPRGGPGAHISIGDGDNRVDYHNFNTRREQDTEHGHFVSTLEGRPAFINTGQSIPVADRTLVGGAYGATVFDSVRYRDVGAGFYVTPRLVGGDGVSLEISPYADKLDPRGGGAIDTRGISTMVAGKVGQWIPLGGAGQSFNDSGRGILYSTNEAGQDIYDVWVKVDIVP